MFQNLKITALLNNAIAMSNQIRLDCILSAAKCKEIMQEDYYSDYKHAGNSETVIKTLSEFLQFNEKYKIFHASFGLLNDKEYCVSYSKRWNNNADELVKYRGKGRAEIDTARGEFKNYHNSIIYRTSSKIVFFARGDKEKISQLLNNYIFYIGKKSSQGFGAIKKWIVEEIENDYSIIKDKLPMRFLPLECIDDFDIDLEKCSSKECALIPPAYRQDYREVCIYYENTC